MNDPYSDTLPPPSTAPVRSDRRSPMRWVVALLATVLVVGGGVGVALLATQGRTAAAQGPTFLPPDTIAYMEARLDLPGDQRDNLISFIGKFPGFADPAAFDLKINDTLDRLTGDATEGRYNYSADIEPWFEGQVSLGIIEVPEDLPGADGDGPGRDDVGAFVGSIGVADREALETFLSRLQADSPDATFTETTHGSTTIVTYSSDVDPDARFSYAVTDRSLLFALEPAHLTAALDVSAGQGPSLADAEAFQERFEGLPAERLAAVYMDLGILREELRTQLEAADGGDMEFVREALDQIPAAVAGSIRAEGDRLVVDTLVTSGEGTNIPPMRATSLAGRMPATTAVYVEMRDVGQGISSVVEVVMGQMGVSPADSQMRQVEEFLGAPVEEFLDWIEDSAIAVSLEGEQVTLGMASTVTDAALAGQRVGRLTTAIRAAAAFGSVPFTVDEADVAGAMVTTITMTGGDGPDLPADLPIEASLSYAIADDVFYLGSGDFVADAIVRTEADSLAGDARYSTTIEASGGATNSGSIYIDLVAIRTFAEASISAEERAGYDLEMRPYLEALDRFSTVARVVDGDVAVRSLLFVE